MSKDKPEKQQEAERARALPLLKAARDRARLRWETLIRGIGSTCTPPLYWIYELEAASALLEFMNTELPRALEEIKAANAALDSYTTEEIYAKLRKRTTTIRTRTRSPARRPRNLREALETH